MNPYHIKHDSFVPDDISQKVFLLMKLEFMHSETLQITFLQLTCLR